MFIADFLIYKLKLFSPRLGPWGFGGGGGCGCSGGFVCLFGTFVIPLELTHHSIVSACESQSDLLLFIEL